MASAILRPAAFCAPCPPSCQLHPHLCPGPLPQFTHRIFGLPPKHFFGKHCVMLSALRDQLAPGGLTAYGATLLQLAEQELSTWPNTGEVSMGWTVVLRLASPRFN